MKKKSILLFWVFSILITILWTFENTDKIEKIKSELKKKLSIDIKIEETQNAELENRDFFNIEANAYDVFFRKIYSIKTKTSFLENNSKNNQLFDIKDLIIYTQSGYKINNNKQTKINLNKNFHLEYNGGIKTILTINNKKFALLTSKKNNCYYAAIVSLETLLEIFKTECLPDKVDNYDFNGLGSSFIVDENYILLSLGTPTSKSSVISELAQNKNSFFGKILKFNKKDFNKEELIPYVYSYGHRNPQGMTKIFSTVFAVEHGPKGGDELNLIDENKNYGWPISSYGTRYFYDNDGKSYKFNHVSNNFEEPLFAFVPSIGISALNKCPVILEKYYKKNCLIGLSLYGNDLRQGKSLIIFLLNDSLKKVDSIEKIFLGPEYPLRHFVTNSNNELYEDANGSIYVSVDNDGIFEIKFQNFR